MLESTTRCATFPSLNGQLPVVDKPIKGVARFFVFPSVALIVPRWRRFQHQQGQYQIQHAQGKLVRAVTGEVFDVVVDIRRSSPTYGKWVGVTLSAENKKMMWIPPGLAHGFAVLSDSAVFLYKTTDYLAPQYERNLLWNDPDIGIAWPLAGDPILAAKDQAGKRLYEAEVFD